MWYTGKTTFLGHFAKFDNVCVLTEPVEEWRNLKYNKIHVVCILMVFILLKYTFSGVNLLHLMYQQPERFAMPFQSYAVLTMLKLHNKQTPKLVKIIERSIFSGRYCFVEEMLANGMIHEGMYRVLEEWYEFINEHHKIHCDLIVYLRTSPQIVYERIKKRARDEESCIPYEYIKRLHERHEDWLIHGHFYQPSQVLKFISSQFDISIW